MKTRAVLIFVSLGAAAITFGQWCYVIGYDNFTGMVVGHDSYKVFRYGFPFPIIEGTPGLPIATPEWQTPWRVVGNFVTFLLAGLFIAWVARFIRKREPHHEIKTAGSAV